MIALAAAGGKQPERHHEGDPPESGWHDARMSRKRRRHGLAASIAAAAPVPPTPIEAALQADVESPCYRNTYAEGRLWDRDGQPWRRVDEFVEPPQALELVRSGVPWLVEWCGERLEWATEQTAGRLLEQVRGELLSKARAQRLRRRRSVPTVIMAEEWQDEHGRPLLVFYETGPYPRADSWFW